MDNMTSTASYKAFKDFFTNENTHQGKSCELSLALIDALSSWVDIEALSADDVADGEVEVAMMLDDGCTTFLMKNHAQMIAFAETLAADAGIEALDTYLHSSVDAELDINNVNAILKGDLKPINDSMREDTYYIAEWLVRYKLMKMLDTYHNHHCSAA